MSDLINISALSMYLECLEQFQIDPQPLLQDCDIDYQMLIRQEGYIAFIKLVKLLELTSKRAHCPHFGLLLSRKQSTSFLRIMGLLTEKSPNVGAALQAIVHHFNTNSQGESIELIEGEQVAMITYRVLAHCPAAAQTVDFNIGTGCFVLRLLSGWNVNPRVIYLSHPKFTIDEVYNRLLGAPVIFNHNLNSLVFDRQLLDQPLCGHNQRIKQLLNNSLESSIGDLEHSIVSEVRKLIAKLLPVGYCSLEEVARQLMMSPRKLQYLLADEDFTFKEMVNQVRIGIAQQHLSQSNTPLSQLSEILGYSDQSAFGRAFKRWFGVSPKGWKKNS